MSGWPVNVIFRNRDLYTLYKDVSLTVYDNLKKINNVLGTL